MAQAKKVLYLSCGWLCFRGKIGFEKQFYDFTKKWSIIYISTFRCNNLSSRKKQKMNLLTKKSNKFQWCILTINVCKFSWRLVGALSNLKNLVNQEIYFWLIFQWLVPLITRKCHHYFILFIHQFIIHYPFFFLQGKCTSVFNNFFQKESPRRPLTRPPVVKKIEWPLDWKSSSSADDISDSFSSQPLSLRPYYPHQNDLYNFEPSFQNNEEINLVFTPYFSWKTPFRAFIINISRELFSGIGLWWRPRRQPPTSWGFRKTKAFTKLLLNKWKIHKKSSH